MPENKIVLVTGASGLVGRPLCHELKRCGHEVRTLSRGTGGDFQWDPQAGQLPEAALEGVDAVIHLAGESVAQRWTASVKRRILESRVQSTQLLVRTILARSPRPAFISASGINYYGYDRDEPLDESSSSGGGFLAEVCRQWEGAAQPLEEAGCRCLYVRTGIVLSGEGGALAKMLPPFKAGLGGPIGDGTQSMSWIALDDLVAIYLRAVEDGSLAGAVNAVAPQPVSNRHFSKLLGKALGRPAIIRTPSLAVRTLFGEMGRETVLSNLSVLPQRLSESQFSWSFPDLQPTLNHYLKK